jgi:hypothetical protein
MPASSTNLKPPPKPKSEMGLFAVSAFLGGNLQGQRATQPLTTHSSFPILCEILFSVSVS